MNGIRCQIRAWGGGGAGSRFLKETIRRQHRGVGVGGGGLQREDGGEIRQNMIKR